MIGIISRGGSNLYGALMYNAEKVNAGQADLLFGNRVAMPSDPSAPFDMHRAMRSFEPYMNSGHNLTKTVFHASLNPDPKDELTDERLTVFMQEYMQRMGYGDQPYYVFRHRDIDREHVHIVSVRMR